MSIMFVIIIIIWIMMARWAGDEIMNNPTIKSHIYMAPRPPWIIMMMREYYDHTFARTFGIFSQNLMKLYNMYAKSETMKHYQLREELYIVISSSKDQFLRFSLLCNSTQFAYYPCPKTSLLKSKFNMGRTCQNVARFCENELQSGFPPV